MHEERDVSEARAATRVTLRPEKRAVGSEDPRAQAREVLRDSKHCTGSAPADEHRRSEDIA